MSDDFDPGWNPSLILAHDGPHPFDAVVPPIAQTSLFTFRDCAEMIACFRGEVLRPVYSRGLNPTVRLFEEKLAELEGAEDAIGFASGMSAISSTLLTFLAPGDRLVSVRHIYPDAFRLFETLFRRFRIDVTYVDGRDPAAVAKALAGAKLLYLESPTSWVMETHDIATLATLARQAGVLSVIDNSWASPIFQRPLTLGVDLVLHSASKYLGGHSDVVAGVTAGPRDLIARVRAEAYPYLGARLSPFDAWLLLRGMRTLPLRMKAHEHSAHEIAHRLRAHPAVETVCYPGLDTPLPTGLTGTSGLFSLILREGINIRAFADALRLFKLGVSWGGHESLIVPAEVILAQKAQPNAALAFGIHPRSARLHVGLEGTEPLWADLDKALALAAV